MKYTILGLGDSITEGKGEYKSYLFPLWRKLDSANYKAKFIGPNSHKRDAGNIMNAGYSGKNAEYLDAHVDSIYTKYPADIVLLHTGHNHFVEEKPVEGIIAAQKSIVSKIVAINPNVKIFIAQVITSGKLPKYSYIPELNKEISHLVEQLKKEGLPVTLVNQAENFNWKIHCLADKVHPNDEGAELMAATWFKAIEQELSNNNKWQSAELVINNSIKKLGISISNLDNKIKKCVEVTQNICDYWKDGSIENKLRVQKLVFPSGIVIDPKKRQYRTCLNDVYYNSYER